MPRRTARTPSGTTPWTRAYYYTTAEYALQNLRCQRVKISDILRLNDPFEFMCLNLRDPDLRRAVTHAKQSIAKSSGVICFSRSWRIPLMWSHYAERHQGICLGFDIPTEHALRVRYVKQRIRMTSAEIVGGTVSDARAKNIIGAKAHYWSYEDEVRLFCSTMERDANNLAFRDFDDELRLREVIVGPHCTKSRTEVDASLGGLRSEVEPFKARIAFGQFRIVRNRNDSLWQ